MEIQLSPELEQIVKDNEAIAIGIEQADRGELFDLDLDQINAELDEEEGYAIDFARHFEPN